MPESISARLALLMAAPIFLLSHHMVALQPIAQTQAQQNDEQSIRVTARLVQVNVVVLNKKGEPVDDLTEKDFTGFDKGQEQKIAFFSKEGAEGSPTNLPPLAPGVVSNRYANYTSGGQTHLALLPTSVTMILLDGLNTAFDDQLYSKEALIKVLAQLRPSDRVAIYALTDQLRVVHDFSSDTESLLAAVQRHQKNVSEPLSSSATTMPIQALPLLICCWTMPTIGSPIFLRRNEHERLWRRFKQSPTMLQACPAARI